MNTASNLNLPNSHTNNNNMRLQQNNTTTTLKNNNLNPGRCVTGNSNNPNKTGVNDSDVIGVISKQKSNETTPTPNSTSGIVNNAPLSPNNNDNTDASSNNSPIVTSTTTTIKPSNGSSGSNNELFVATNNEHLTPNLDNNLSKTNLYIRGLQSATNDEDLYSMCSRFGQITSTKAIVDKLSGCCKGYGFVEFASPQSASLAVQELTKSGVQAQMAKISPVHLSHYNHQNNHHNHQQNHHHHHHHNNNNQINNGSNSNGNTSGSGGGGIHRNNHNSTSNPDPTNLYIANLPPNMSEQELENLLSTYGPVVSTRILRDQSNIPRGVGFARMESRDKCEQIIEQLNGRPYKGWKEPLLVKFADGGNKKRHHHNNHQYQHHNNNLQHHKVHQDDSRWRVESSSNASDLGSVSNYDHQSNLSHSNQLSDLAMIGALGYPRISPGYPPTVAPGTGYPSPLNPPTSAPQWIHPGGPGQPYVIPQHVIQAGSLGPTNQVAAAPALHYGHIPQLTSQMQGLQLGHPGEPVCRYFPSPHHQWSALWTHPVPPPQPQPSLRLPAPLQHSPPANLQQQTPQSNTVQQQPPTAQ